MNDLEIILQKFKNNEKEKQKQNNYNSIYKTYLILDQIQHKIKRVLEQKETCFLVSNTRDGFDYVYWCRKLFQNTYYDFRPTGCQCYDIKIDENGIKKLNELLLDYKEQWNNINK